MERIESPGHPALAAATQLTTSLGRAAAGWYQLERGKLVRQAWDAGVQLAGLFLVDDEPDLDLAAEAEQRGEPCFLLPPGMVKRLTGTGYSTRLDAIGLAPRRLAPELPPAGLLLLCESIQDPRNVGVIIRTAEAAGVAGLAFSDDSADPFSRPAVRSSTGSILRQPVHLAADLPALLSRLREAGVAVLGTSAKATEPLWSLDLTGPVAVVIGSESAGLSDAARQQTDLLAALPVRGSASSLNVTVAAGAILYEAARQRLR